MSVLGRTEVGNRFFTLIGRGATPAELDQLEPLYESKGWDFIDGKILSLGQRRVPADDAPPSAVPGATGGGGVPWVPLVAAAAVLLWFRK